MPPKSVDFETAVALITAAEAGLKGFAAEGQCQACFREFSVRPTATSSKYLDIGITRGKIGMVLHGFERPGYGYLKGMCWGAGHPPYELSCEVTKVWRKSLHDHVLPRQREHLARLVSGEEKRFLYHYTRYVSSEKGWGGKHQDFEVWVTEGEPLPPEFEEKKLRAPDFKALRAQAIGNMRSEIRHTEEFIVFLDGRVKNWVFAPEKLLPEVRKKAPVDVSALPPEQAAKHEAKAAKEREHEEKERKVKAVIDTLLGDPAFSAYLRTMHEKMTQYGHRPAGPERDRLSTFAVPGEPTLYDYWQRKYERARGGERHTDRMFSLKRTATDLKYIASNAGIKVKLPKAT